MNKKSPSTNRPELSRAFPASGAVSAYEYTGLIPATPADAEELDSYYQLAAPAAKKRMGE